jgi:hypothetical protein
MSPTFLPARSFCSHLANGAFPMKYEDGTIGLMHVSGGRIQRAELLKGNRETMTHTIRS